MKYKSVGGTAQPGSLGDAFTQFLQGGITGSFPGGSGAPGGASGVFGDILSAGAGQYGGALKTLMDQQKTTDLANLRESFGNTGGGAFGTGGAYAQSNYLAKAAPAFTQAITQTQMQALGQLLPFISQIAGRQIPQAQTVGVQNPWVQGLNIGGQVIGDIGSIIGDLHGLPSQSPNQGQVPGSSSMMALPQGIDLNQLATMFSNPNWAAALTGGGG